MDRVARCPDSMDTPHLVGHHAGSPISRNQTGRWGATPRRGTRRPLLLIGGRLRVVQHEQLISLRLKIP